MKEVQRIVKECIQQSNIMNTDDIIEVAEYKVSDTITVTLKGAKEVVKGKVEKLNPLKVRTGATSIVVLPNPLIKTVVKEPVNEIK